MDPIRRKILKTGAAATVMARSPPKEIPARNPAGPRIAKVSFRTGIGGKVYPAEVFRPERGGRCFQCRNAASFGN